MKQLVHWLGLSRFSFPFKSVRLPLAVDRCCLEEIMKQYNVLHHCSSKTKQRTATFTQLITSVDCLPSSCCLNVAIRPRRPYGLLWTGEPRTSTSTFTQLISYVDSLLQTISHTIKDGEPRMATSTVTQILSSAPSLTTLTVTQSLMSVSVCKLFIFLHN